MTAVVAAIVLAAGESSRMGQPKPLLPLDGETFLGHLLAEIRSSRVDQTIVVVGHRPDVILSAMPEIAPLVVVNHNYALGQLSSLRVGLDTLGERADAILLSLADHPFASHTLIDTIIDAHERSQSPIVIPVHQGRRGHPTLFARSLFPELRSAPLDQGARVVVHAHAADVLELPTDDAGVVADVDTPEQYAQWLAWHRARRGAGNG
ncbi:MAG: NTP transferase domain-containing protein [Chloroflexi bacterium]|nr:NTP transferase domain-containing protein [Chloroflexota bacterium]